MGCYVSNYWAVESRGFCHLRDNLSHVKKSFSPSRVYLFLVCLCVCLCMRNTTLSWPQKAPVKGLPKQWANTSFRLGLHYTILWWPVPGFWLFFTKHSVSALCPMLSPNWLRRRTDAWRAGTVMLRILCVLQGEISCGWTSDPGDHPFPWWNCWAQPCTSHPTSQVSGSQVRW